MIGALLASMQEVLGLKPWCDGVLGTLGTLIPSCVTVSPTFPLHALPPIL